MFRLLGLFGFGRKRVSSGEIRIRPNSHNSILRHADHRLENFEIAEPLVKFVKSLQDLFQNIEVFWKWNISYVREPQRYVLNVDFDVVCK